MNNTVELLGYYGSDITIACSAWTSTSRELTKEKINRIPKLLKFLADNKHETPFEKSSLHFLVNSDIASHIQIIKHRVAVSVNAESARYKELKEDKFYVPEDWKKIKHSKPNQIVSENWEDTLNWYSNLGNKLYHEAIGDLTPILGRKRAKESARFFKTYNSQIQCDIMFNFRSFVHFLRLRNTEEAQKEIRDISQIMLQLVKDVKGNPFRYTIEAFNL
jgi:flavin-dependent thymidylate synthase